MTEVWIRHQPIQTSSPVLAVLSGPNGVWAGGLGGVAWFEDDVGWKPLVSGLPLTTVTALAAGAGLLLAGGLGGIARSSDRGHSWSVASIPDGAATVTSLALSPSFAEDGEALAATLDNGILRSTDFGRTWTAASFGLRSHEILAFAWGRDGTVFAATRAGLHRSTNSGRAWRVVAGTEDIAVAAVAALPDGSVLAAPETGPPVRFNPVQSEAVPLPGLPETLQTWSLMATAARTVLLGSSKHGMFLSPDGGETWSTVSPECAIAFTGADGRIYAGTETGVVVSHDGGTTWFPLPPPPLSDLRRLLTVGGNLLVFGANSPPVLRDPDVGWTSIPSVPLPLSGLFVPPDDAVFASGPNGLFRSLDRGGSWEQAVSGDAGQVGQMTFLPGGRGWAGVTPDAAILSTEDGGRTWNRLHAPFGVLPVVALLAIPGASDRSDPSLTAATYDNRQRTVCLWRSDDGGDRWVRGADSFTPWPVIATCASPPVIAIGNTITVRCPDGRWQHTAIDDTGIRRVVGDGMSLVALGVEGLWRSEDGGMAWTRDDMQLPLEKVIDVAFDPTGLHVLLAGQQVWSRRFP
jgi:photosystem II stability/assembly factor-like uncharacterized protein